MTLLAHHRWTVFVLAAIWATAATACCDDEVSVTIFQDGITGHPGSVAAGADGRMFFTEQFDDRVGWLTPATGTSVEVAVPRGTHPHFIIEAPDGMLWFSGLGGFLGSLDPQTGKTEVYDAGISPGGEPHFLVVDPDDDTKLWFTEQKGDRVARFDTTSKRATEFDVTPGSEPHGAALSPDGQFLWFALQYRNRLGRLDLTSPINDQSSFDAAFVEFPLVDPAAPPEGSGPHDLLFTPDGMLYLTLQASNRIGRFDPHDQSFTTFDTHLPRETRGQDLQTMVLTPDGAALLFNIFVSGSIGRFDLATGDVTELAAGLDAASGPLTMVRGPGRSIWFTIVSLTAEPGRLARLDVKE